MYKVIVTETSNNQLGGKVQEETKKMEGDYEHNYLEFGFNELLRT